MIDYYDSVHKLIDAACILNGWRFKGEGAHREMIDMVHVFGLAISDRAFLQSIRDYRNRIQYEGHHIDVGFIERNATRFEGIIATLNAYLEERGIVLEASERS